MLKTNITYVGSEIVYSRPHPSLVPSPEQYIENLIQQTANYPDIIHKPSIPSQPWSLASKTIKGNVRTDNQDYAVSLEINGYQIMVIADGVGGLPSGKEAAYLAVDSATCFLIRYFGHNHNQKKDSLDHIALEALHTASFRLAFEGDKLNIGHKGLRTTLIVILTGTNQIGYAYAGDGGACLVTSTGDIYHFLKPHKLEDASLNNITTSLGPTIHGNPVSGSLYRPVGSVIVAGTDGVFDRLEPNRGSFPQGTNAFIRRIIDGACRLSGNLQDLINQVLHELASHKDGQGHVFHDNLTMGVLADGEAPTFCSPKEDQNNNTKEPSITDTEEESSCSSNQ